MFFQIQGIQLSPKPRPKVDEVIPIHMVDMLIEKMDPTMKLQPCWVKRAGGDKGGCIPLIRVAPLSASVRLPSIAHNLPHPCSQNQGISAGDIKLGTRFHGRKHGKQKRPIQSGKRSQGPNYARKKKENETGGAGNNENILW